MRTGKVDHIYDVENKLSAVQYHIDIMLNRTLSMFSYSGLPDSLPETMFEGILQTMGKAIVTEHKGELVAFWGNWGAKKNLYYFPTSIIVANPWAEVFREFEIEGEKEAVLVKNDPLCKGLLPIFQKYGVFNAEADITFRNALVIFRAMLNIICPDDRSRASAEEYINRLQAGKLTTMLDDDWMTDKRVTNQALASSIQGYITQAIEAMQYIKGTEMNDLGLQTNYNMKRESLSEAETTMNEDALRPLIDSMLEERKKAIEKINAKYGTAIEVEFGSAWSRWNPADQMPAAEIPEEEQPEEAIDEEIAENEETEETAVTEQVSGSDTPDDSTGNDPVDDGTDDGSDVANPVEEIVQEVAEAVEEIVEEIKEELTGEEEQTDEETDT